MRCGVIGGGDDQLEISSLRVGGATVLDTGTGVVERALMDAADVRQRVLDGGVAVDEKACSRGL
jgi:hypothetical protein